jgi:hypothetical protein
MKIVHMVAAQPGWYAQHKIDDKTILSAVAVWVTIEAEDGVVRVSGYAESPEEWFLAEDEAQNFAGWTYLPQHIVQSDGSAP